MLTASSVAKQRIAHYITYLRNYTRILKIPSRNATAKSLDYTL